jgi:hypothetical protein
MRGRTAREADKWQTPRVKLFLFHCDEIDILSDWLQYHSFMFGFKNIHVVDNMSKGVGVCKLLALYAQCGVTVTEYSGDFSGKFSVLSSVMRNESADFLLPLDADEFVVHVNKQGSSVNFNPLSMAQLFASLPVDGRKYKFHEFGVKYNKDTCTRNVDTPQRRVTLPGRLMKHQREPAMIKTFFHADGFIGTDQGNHYGRVKHDALAKNTDPAVPRNLSMSYIFSPVSLLTFAVPSHHAIGAKMQRGAAAYGFTEVTNCSAVGSGTHYCQAAREFREHTASSQYQFTAQCLASEGAPATTQFSKWFAHHAMTMEQLLGPDTPAELGNRRATRRKRWSAWADWLFSHGRSE